jgi:hypothetical protein
MGERDDDTAVQKKAQLRLLSAMPALRLQDSAERADASGIAYHPVPEMRRSIRRDGWPETRQHVLSAALPAAAYMGLRAKQAGVAQASRGFQGQKGAAPTALPRISCGS